MVWHKDTEVPKADIIVLPGGFSYGDYLRCGAIAAHSPVVRDVVAKAKAGTPVLGVCNGFQILLETGLLPGALMRNAHLKFVCREVTLSVANRQSLFTGGYQQGQTFRCPVAHHDGNYFADADLLARLEGEGRVALRYADGTNPNGSVANIAGVLSESGTVLGMMPHPEDHTDPAQGSLDGLPLFTGIVNALA